MQKWQRIVILEFYIRFITKDSIDAMNSFLDTKWEGLKAVPQTHKMHCFIPISSGEILVAETSDTTQFKVAIIRKPSDTGLLLKLKLKVKNKLQVKNTSIDLGQWVVVTYDGSRYPGEVISMEDSQYEINVMHPSGNHWKWPTAEDKIFYLLQNIAQLINPPKAAGNHGQFRFDEQI